MNIITGISYGEECRVVDLTVKYSISKFTIFVNKLIKILLKKVGNKNLWFFRVVKILLSQNATSHRRFIWKLWWSANKRFSTILRMPISFQAIHPCPWYQFSRLDVVAMLGWTLVIWPGEQDFSLSLAIQKKYQPHVLVATAFDAGPSKYEFWNNINELKANGAVVAFNVDALKLETSLHKAVPEEETLEFGYDVFQYLNIYFQDITRWMSEDINGKIHRIRWCASWLRTLNQCPIAINWENGMVDYNG